MDCRPTSTNPRAGGRRAGFTLMEMVMAAGITGMLFVTLGSISIMSSRGMAALGNYVDLNDQDRLAMDQLSGEIRAANRLSAYTTNSITLDAVDGVPITYRFDSSARTFTRIRASTSSILLRDCDSLAFRLGQRNTVGGSYDVFPAADVSNCKVVDVSWSCSKTVMSVRQNTETVQTARIVIRRQGT